MVNVAIAPGEGWDRGNATDEDSDREEDPVASGSKLPATIQAGVASARRRRQSVTGARKRARLGEEEEEEEENLDSQDSQEEEQERQEQEGVWVAQNPGLLGTNIPVYTPPHYTYEQEIELEACKTALDWYELFSPVEWLDYVTGQTMSYAISMGRSNKTLASLTKENIR